MTRPIVRPDIEVDRLTNGMAVRNEVKNEADRVIRVRLEVRTGACRTVTIVTIANSIRIVLDPVSWIRSVRVNANVTPGLTIKIKMQLRFFLEFSLE